MTMKKESPAGSGQGIIKGFSTTDKLVRTVSKFTLNVKVFLASWAWILRGLA